MAGWHMEIRDTALGKSRSGMVVRARLIHNMEAIRIGQCSSL